MSYVVTAPCVLAQDEEGKTHHVYAGGVIEWLSDAQEAHFLAEGLVEKVDQPAAADEPDSAEDSPVEPEGGRPAHVALKAVWVDYAVARGFERAEAEGMTKDELIDALG